MHPWKYQYHMACCLSTEAWINYSEQCAGLSTLNSCYTRVVSDVPLSRCMLEYSNGKQPAFYPVMDN